MQDQSVADIPFGMAPDPSTTSPVELFTPSPSTTMPFNDTSYANLGSSTVIPTSFENLVILKNYLNILYVKWY